MAAEESPSRDLSSPLLEGDGLAGSIQEQERDYFPAPIRPRTSVFVTMAREIGSPRCAMVTTVAVNVPQILAAICVLVLYWNRPDKGDCHSANIKFKLWISFCAIRLFLTTIVTVRRYVFVEVRGYDEHSRNVRALSNMRNALEACAIVWFIIGNMWLFSTEPGDPGTQCHDWLYWVFVGMICAQYAQICLPCIVAIMLVPVFCFCLPCFVRLLSAIHDPMDGKGADQHVIDQLPLISYREPAGAAAEDNAEDRPSCPICLGDFVVGDTVRVLPCKHQYHQKCVDQWLMVNASCPSCRLSIVEPDAKGSEGD